MEILGHETPGISNLIMIQSLRSIYNLLQHGVFHNRHLLYGQKRGRDALLAQHRAIFDGVMSGDPDRAEQAVREHMKLVAEAWRGNALEAERAATAQKRLNRYLIRD